MQIRWRDSLSIDCGPIDADHKYLIDLINMFLIASEYASNNKEITEILGKLKIYTNIHFKREEALQKACNYPDYNNHKQEHSNLIRKLDDIIEGVNNNSSIQSEEKFLETRKFLITWLIKHVIGHDLGMKDYVDRMYEVAMDMPSIDQEVIMLD